MNGMENKKQAIEWLETHANLCGFPICFFYNSSLCCILLHYYGTLIESFVSIFSTFVQRNFSIFHIFLIFSWCVKFNELVSFFFWRISRIVPERLRILIHISIISKLWTLWKKRSPTRMSPSENVTCECRWIRQIQWLKRVVVRLYILAVSTTDRGIETHLFCTLRDTFTLDMLIGLSPIKTSKSTSAVS